MGIKNFSKTFKEIRIVKYKDLQGLTIAIDAMTEIYRAALGASSINVLTDVNGNPTLHISVILSIVLELHKNQVNQIWVFDHNQDPNVDFHNPMKLNELAKRKKRKDIALDQIKKLTDVQDTDPLFSDDEDDLSNQTDTKTDSKHQNSIKTNSKHQNTIKTNPQHQNSIKTDSKLAEPNPELLIQKKLKKPEFVEPELTPEEEQHLSGLTERQKKQFLVRKISEANKLYKQQLEEYELAIAKKSTKTSKLNSLEKQTFKASKEMINEIKYMLSVLNIKFIEAPCGFEGEAIATYLNKINKVDAVFSGDTDPIAYGAKVLLRRNPRDKQIYEYTQEDILRQIEEGNPNIKKASLMHLLKCALALGTDANEKTPGIGPGTVLKKLHLIELTDEQKNAISEFTKEPDTDIKIIHRETESTLDKSQISSLIEWLATEKSFSKSRLISQFEKAVSTKESAKATKTQTTKATKTQTAKTDNPQKSAKSPRYKSKSPIRYKSPIKRKPRAT